MCALALALVLGCDHAQTSPTTDSGDPRQDCQDAVAAARDACNLAASDVYGQDGTWGICNDCYAGREACDNAETDSAWCSNAQAACVDAMNAFADDGCGQDTGWVAQCETLRDEATAAAQGAFGCL